MVAIVLLLYNSNNNLYFSTITASQMLACKTEHRSFPTSGCVHTPDSWSHDLDEGTPRERILKLRLQYNNHDFAKVETIVDGPLRQIWNLAAVLSAVVERHRPVRGLNHFDLQLQMANPFPQ